MVRHLLHGWEYFVLLYFSVLALIYALSGYLGMRSVILYARELSQLALKDLLERDFFKPVSILVPAFNEGPGIVAGVQSMLGLQYPQFEVVLASDGSTDSSLELLIEAFALVELPQIYRPTVPTAPVRRVLRSLRYPNLTVIDKENGGKADAQNAALNLARFPLVCVVDADSVLHAEALIRVSRMFIEDETVIGVGGTIRPMNGAVVRQGQIEQLRAPGSWIERIQVLEYSRAFFTARAAWSRLGCLLLISGAFGLFRRDVVLEAGGWLPQSMGEDMEMVLRLHRRFRQLGRPYRLVATPDPVCWTAVPSTFKALSSQRERWQRGTWEVLWRHRSMLFNPKYGRVGMIGVPYLWIFEAMALFVEALGYVVIVGTAIAGVLNYSFAALFIVLAIMYGALLSELAMGVESLLLSRYNTFEDRMRLFAASFVEYIGFRQALLVVRCIASFQVRRRRGRWTAAPKSAEADL